MPTPAPQPLPLGQPLHLCRETVLDPTAPRWRRQLAWAALKSARGQDVHHDVLSAIHSATTPVARVPEAPFHDGLALDPPGRPYPTPKPANPITEDDIGDGHLLIALAGLIATEIAVFALAMVL